VCDALPSSARFMGYNNQSQSCSQTGGSITFTLQFEDRFPDPPTNPKIENSAMNGAVACGTISLSWVPGTGATTFNLYRSTDKNNRGGVWQAGVTGTSFTDTSPALNTTYYYWIQSVNQFGTSDAILASPQSGVIATQCIANFGTSNKVITKVNGKDYKFNSGCRISSQAGTGITIKKGDVITVAFNLCNTGTLNASNIQIKDNLANTNLSLQDPSTVKIVGANGNFTQQGTELIFNVDQVQAGKNVGITFDLVVTAPTGTTQKLLRLRNLGLMVFSTSSPSNNGGCNGTGTDYSNPCRLDTGYIVFSNQLKAPDQEEVKP